jgi:O-antigen/teichoic acid export membrane protein
MASAANLALNVLLARALSTEEFGVFALCFVLGQFLIVLHNTTIGYFISLRSADKPPQAFLTKACSALLTTVALGMLAGSVAWLALTQVTDHLVALSVFAMIVLSLVHETAKQALFCAGKLGESVAMDGVSYGGRLLVVIAALMMDTLTVATVFASFCFCSAVASIYGLRRLGLSRSLERLAVQDFGSAMRECLSLAKWSGSATILIMISTLAIQWVLFLASGAAAVGTLQALSVLLGFTHPVLAMGRNVLVPLASSTYHLRGYLEARSEGFRLIGGIGAALLPFWIALVCLPRICLDLVYGAGAFAGLELPLSIYATSYLLFFAGMNLSSLLIALRRPKESWNVQAANATTLLLVGIAATATNGLTGAVLSHLLASAVSLAVAMIELRNGEPLPIDGTDTRTAK